MPDLGLPRVLARGESGSERAETLAGDVLRGALFRFGERERAALPTCQPHMQAGFPP